MTKEEAYTILGEALVLLSQEDDVYEDAPGMLLKTTDALGWALAQFGPPVLGQSFNRLLGKNSVRKVLDSYDASTDD